MPREARIVLPGYLHHVTQRGNQKQRIFDEDQDFLTYLKYLHVYTTEHGVEIFAFCLMMNHVHLILRPKTKESLASALKTAHHKYALYYHKKHNSSGHLWQGRFYSCTLIGDHIDDTFRYVENNPVRAGLVANPWDFKWSSCRAHLGTTYHLVHLADRHEYIKDADWKTFIQRKQTEETILRIQKMTRKGKH